MIKRNIMKILSLISILCTIYIIFGWNPKYISDKLNYSNGDDRYNIEINSIVEDDIINEDYIINTDDNSSYKEEGTDENLKDVEVNIMIDDLSEEEKALFKVTTNKLSVTDINTIEKILESNENSYGISEVLAFLEIRLSDDDYSKIRNIFIKEVDIIEEINVES